MEKKTEKKTNSDTVSSTDSLIEILELHRSEMQLIQNLRRKFRFGEVTIVVRDGLPVQIRRVTEFELLK